MEALQKIGWIFNPIFIFTNYDYKNYLLRQDLQKRIYAKIILVALHGELAMPCTRNRFSEVDSLP